MLIRKLFKFESAPSAAIRAGAGCWPARPLSIAGQPDISF